MGTILSLWLIIPLVVVHNSPACGSKILSLWLKNPPILGRTQKPPQENVGYAGRGNDGILGNT